MDIDELKETEKIIQEEIERKESERRGERTKAAEKYVGRYFRYKDQYFKTISVFPYDPTVFKCAVIEMNETWSPGIEGSVPDIRITMENVQLLDFDGNARIRYKEIGKEEFEGAVENIAKLLQSF